MDEIEGVYNVCPICEAERTNEQPEYSLHAFTLIYECGTEIDYPIGHIGAMYGASCDGKVKRTIITPEMLVRLTSLSQSTERSAKIKSILR